MSAVHPVFGVEQARCRALETGDIGSLEEMLSHAVVYVHATGSVHDRQALLVHLRERVRFTLVQRAGLELFGDGHTVWLTGLMRLVGRRLPGDEPFTSTSFVTQVWVRRADRWMLTLLQSTKVPDDMWPADAGKPAAPSSSAGSR